MKWLAGVAAVRIDQSGRIDWVSDGFKAMFPAATVDRGDMLGTSFRDGDKPATGANAGPLIVQSTSSGGPDWVQLTPLNPETAAGSPMLLVTDVSELAHSERDALAVFKALSSSQAVIEFTPDGMIRWANDNFRAAMGYTAEELAGQHHRIFVTQDYAASQDYAELWRSLAKGDFRNGEIYRVRKDGSGIWLNATYTGIRDSRGEVTRVLKFASDITAQKTLFDELVTSLTRLAEGNLTTRMTDAAEDAFAEVRNSYNGMVTDLETRVSTVSESTQRIGWVMDAVRDNAEAVARHAMEQSAMIEQTAAGVDQIAAKVNDSSGTAKTADDLARNAAAKSDAGKAVVAGTISSIKGIEEIMGEVSKITKVIESFAFQTNLLSINAAVEAARAGDAGKGFSVVAAEVRNLAQRSSEASKDIANLIAKSQKGVTQGAEKAEAAGESLAEIDAAVSELVATIETMAQTTADQAQGLNDVSKAVATVKGQLQSFVALSKDGVEHAEHLSAEQRKLGDAIGHFHTGPSVRGVEAPKSDGSPALATRRQTG
jgi:methyl-accepting chemotaxis protein